jgi:hypothetical protein
MANFIGYRRSVGPNEVEHLESSLAALTHDDVGLGLAAALNVLMAVETYVIGFALRDQQELRIERSGAQRLEGDTQAEVRQYLRNLKAVGRYPNLSLLFESGIALERDERFDYGLGCLLDGIERDLELRFAAT